MSGWKRQGTQKFRKAGAFERITLMSKMIQGTEVLETVTSVLEDQRIFPREEPMTLLNLQEPAAGVKCQSERMLFNNQPIT
jgi:hypothetical protein